jgi:hypothetical protein
MLQPTVSLSWCQAPIWGPIARFVLLDYFITLLLLTRYLLLFYNLHYNWGFVDVEFPLWRVDGCVVYNRYRPSQAQSFSGPGPAGLTSIFYSLRFQTSRTWGATSSYLHPPGRGHSILSLGSGLAVRRHLRLAGLCWSYLNCPHAGTG